MTFREANAIEDAVDRLTAFECVVTVKGICSECDRYCDCKIGRTIQMAVMECKFYKGDKVPGLSCSKCTHKEKCLKHLSSTECDLFEEVI